MTVHVFLRFVSSANRVFVRMKLPTKKEQLVDITFNPDGNGVSRWVPTNEIAKLLKWSTNGNQRHGVFFGDNRYNWEKRPDKGKVTHVRTIGFSDFELIKQTRPIRRDIREHYNKQPCAYCGTTSDLIVDHKNDLYNDPRVLNENTQTVDDFQSLCNRCNSIKSSAAIITRKTGKRYSARKIPMLANCPIEFLCGDASYDPTDVNAMVGTFWYDPKVFMDGVFGIDHSTL